MTTALKIITKIILTPIALLALILSVIINILAQLSAYAVGPLCLFIFACAAYSAFHQAWLHVGILTGTFILVQICYLAAAMLTNLCECLYISWARI